MSAHTPGPWEAKSRSPQEWTIDAPQGDPTIGYRQWTGLAVAEVYGCDDLPEKGVQVAEANARLIAAAPDLLEALQELMPAYEARMADNENVEWNACWNKAIASIAKAIGSVA